jgi:transcription initiation factor TFIIIB Brf1 subunit/transcription initiation factor TFIIB
MGCKKGKSKAKWKPGRYVCRKCGAVVKKKDQVCKPRLIEENEGKD